MRTVGQALQARGVEPMHPVTQRLTVRHAKAGRDPFTKISPTPAYHGILRQVRTSFHPPGQFRPLRHPTEIQLAQQPAHRADIQRRSNYLSHRVFDDYQAILKACRNAWNALIAMPQTITSIATRTWAQVKI